MTGTDGSRTGSGGSGGRARPRLANPYGLGTWTGAEPDAAETAPADDESRGARHVTSRHPMSQASGSQSPEPRTPQPPPGSASTPRTLARTAPRQPAGTSPVAAGRGAGDVEGEQVFYDPPELPSPPDPFELARRTVNRSRAAARDRGLFPISAKTQARDVRDRSGRAPGYSGSRPDPRDPQGIESVLRKVLGTLGWNAGMSAGRVLEEWDDIVGERIATHCRPVSFEEGVLVVSASSSAWASQLRMLTPQLITTIEERVGSHVISELKVTGPAAAERTWKKGRRTVTWRGPRDTYG